MTRISAPVFVFGNSRNVKTADAYVPAAAANGELALTGPSPRAKPGHSPVRGDLAHIRLAGLHFVPHYAVPMPHTVSAGGAALRAAAQEDADTLCRLEPGAEFAVLDIAGGWAWGQAGHGLPDGDGPVGYVSLDRLVAEAS